MFLGLNDNDRPSLKQISFTIKANGSFTSRVDERLNEKSFQLEQRSRFRESEFIVVKMFTICVKLLAKYLNERLYARSLRSAINHSDDLLRSPREAHE